MMARAKAAHAAAEEEAEWSAMRARVAAAEEAEWNAAIAAARRRSSASARPKGARQPSVARPRLVFWP
jgi:hypothetical protein